MHIKALTVHGFKSYRDETTLGPLSPRHNVVVGRNGSGKSNFFSALRFVLGDAYGRLGGAEERQALLHDGGMSAYVEAVFDNADGRFPTGRAETRIRRTVGLKKDEYAIDGRPAAKADVASLLQAAGFSPANPYYVVAQGRVAALTAARDDERLALLQDVAGTSTYEEHRGEALRILEETRGRRARIAELLAYISARLSELDAERAQLSSWQRLERRRRVLERALASQRVSELDAAIAELTGGDGDGAASGTVDGAAAALAECVSASEATAAALAEAEAALAEATDELQRLRAEDARLSSALADAQGEAQRASASEARRVASLAETNDLIGRREDALSEANSQLASLSAEEARLSADAEAAAAASVRRAQFRSAGERDKWLRREADVLSSGAAQTRRTAAALGDELETARLRLADAEAILVANQSAPAGAAALVSGGRAEERRALWRAEGRVATALAGARTQVAAAERDLSAACPGDGAALAGLAAVRRLAAPGAVLGAVYELVRPRDAVFGPALDAALGPALLSVVVDSADTAASLMDALRREKGGRVTFVPLDALDDAPSISGDALRLPVGADDAVLLRAHVDADGAAGARVADALLRAVAVVRALGTPAAAALRAAGFSAVTLAGERADRRGALTGGTRAQRIEAAGRLAHWTRKAAEAEALLADVRVRISALDSAAAAYDSHSETSQADAPTEEAVEEMRRGVAERAAAVAALEAQATAAESRAAALRAEVGTPLGAGVDEAAVEALRARLRDVGVARAAAASRVASLSAELREVLLPRRRALVAGAARGPAEADISALSDLLSGVRASLAAAEAEAERLSDERLRLIGRRNELAAAAEHARETYDAAVRAAARDGGQAERRAARLAALGAERESALRVLGTVVPDGVSEPMDESESGDAEERGDQDAIRRRSADGMAARLAEVNAALRRDHGHVNKRAHEQHAAFARQGAALRARVDELASSADAISDFVAALDRRKDEAVERTFSQVSASFSDVFARLVPGGRAELVIVRACDDASGSISNSQGPPKKASQMTGAGPMSYVGVGMRAAFAPGGDWLQTAQLSGGQRSMLALALIFAIQACDPAPFYLFDEIDANLDAGARASVAAFIASAKAAGGRDTQFVTTTFRPELVADADAFFGVSFGGRVSRVEAISREQALRFVDPEPSF